MSLTVDGDYVEQEYLEDDVIEARDYQLDLAESALQASSLIALPTGMGKTPVALLTLVERLSQYPEKKVVMVAPTKPLVEQHADFFRDALWISDDRVKVFNGDVRPDKRAQLWDDPDTTIVISTPQCMKNDITGNRADMSDVCHLIVDECHRATGDYPYTYVAERYNAEADDPLVTGLSASPGADRDEILNVCQNLGIESVHIKTSDDPSLAKYQPDVDVRPHKVELPEDVEYMRDKLQEVYKEQLKQLKEIGVINSARKDFSMGKLQRARGDITEMIQNDESEGYKAASIHAAAVKVGHAIKAVESESVSVLQAKLEEYENDDSKAAQRLMEDERIQEVKRMAQNYDGLNPKLSDLRVYTIETIAEGGQVIVFADSRDIVDEIVEFLTESNIPAKRFVGQSSKDGKSGMTQTQQQSVLDEFRAGEFDVLVATSVAEEGLDIPAVDLVLFYEPVGSALRAIQRRGRTGRETEGKVIVMMAEGTRDEGLYWAAKRSESQMKDDMSDLKEEEVDLNEELGGDTEQEDLSTWADDETEDVDTDVSADDVDQAEVDTETPTENADGTATVLVDNREMDSSVPPTLSAMDDVTVTLENLDVADYVLSDRVAVERKSMEDFLDTLTGGDRSIFDQLGDLAYNYDRPILILEGDLDELYARNIHPNAVRGALDSLVVGFGITVLPTRGEDDTAAHLARIANREQTEESSEVSEHARKTAKTEAEQQEYIVSSIADVGPVTAKKLLERFGSVRGVMTADTTELQQVEGVGQKTATHISNLVTAEYDPQ